MTSGAPEFDSTSWVLVAHAHHSWPSLYYSFCTEVLEQSLAHVNDFYSSTTHRSQRWGQACRADSFKSRPEHPWLFRVTLFVHELLSYFLRNGKGLQGQGNSRNVKYLLFFCDLWDFFCKMRSSTPRIWNCKSETSQIFTLYLQRTLHIYFEHDCPLCQIETLCNKSI